MRHLVRVLKAQNGVESDRRGYAGLAFPDPVPNYPAGGNGD
jgi:hypothetical protein